MLSRRKDKGKSHNYFNICGMQHKIISKSVAFPFKKKRLLPFGGIVITVQQHSWMKFNPSNQFRERTAKQQVYYYRIYNHCNCASELGNSDVGKFTDFCIIVKAKMKTTLVCRKVHLKH